MRLLHAGEDLVQAKKLLIIWWEVTLIIENLNCKLVRFDGIVAYGLGQVNSKIGRRGWGGGGEGPIRPCMRQKVVKWFCLAPYLGEIELQTCINFYPFESSMKWPFKDIFSVRVNKDHWLRRMGRTHALPKKSLYKPWLGNDITIWVNSYRTASIYSLTIQFYHVRISAKSKKKPCSRIFVLSPREMASHNKSIDRFFSVTQ